MLNMEPVEGVKFNLISMFLIIHLFCISTDLCILFTYIEANNENMIYVMPVFHIYQGVLYLRMFNIMDHQNAQRHINSVVLSYLE